MNSRDVLDLIWIVPVLPLLGSAVLLLFGRRLGEPRAGWLASALMVAAFAMSCWMLGALLGLPADGRLEVHRLFTWLPAGSFSVNVGTQADPLSVIWILLVTGVGSLIHIYSLGYMRGDRLYTRFFAYLNLFAAMMLILVLADNFLLTFLGWEGVGLASYLLISFWYERTSAAVAGKKAFITNRVGDVGFLIAMFLMISTYGTLSYTATGPAAKVIGSGVATAIGLLLFVGAMGKSAQIPLHVWLTDAMEGPTPVSALIHAATMVTAGVFLMCRSHVFLEAGSGTSTVIAWVGAATALLAGLVAVTQPDIKRVLAYSTISQLGYMFLAIGVHAYVAAVFMVLCHAFYKGCLFLGAGSVIHGNAENQDLRIMGAFKKFMPFTAAFMTVAWLAIAGLPPFAGFWSKDDILVNAFGSHSYGVWAVGTVAAIVTGIYMTRLILLTFYGNSRSGAEITVLPVVAGGSDDGHDHPDHTHHADHGDHGFDPDYLPTVQFGETPRESRLHGHAPHESPVVMLFPLGILALLAAVGGLLNLPIGNLDFLGRFLEPVFSSVHETTVSTGTQLTVEAISVVCALAGVLVAFRFYRRGLAAPGHDPIVDGLAPATKVAGHAFYLDEGIAKLVDGPGRAGASWLDRVFDQKIIDGAVNGTGWLFQWKARVLSKAEDGFVRRYALAIILGTTAILLFLLLWAGR
ncbi:MAG: NADH-quinone oxidoreductase subunit L [Actinomycetes bacterium]